ncbi:23S rRNA (guanosine(2251)-2'-O)-methyltransferase RlmB [Candidatus Hydrogenedentota bacterium]
MPRPTKRGRRKHPGRNEELDSAMVYGKNPVRELLRADPGRVLELNICESSLKSCRELQSLAESKNVQTRVIPRNDFERLVSGVSHQGVCAAISPLPARNLAQLERDAGKAVPNALFVFLDQIEDPHNMGAIIRSAAAFGADGIVAPGAHSANLSGIVAKSSAGAIAYVPIYSVPNLTEALKRARKAGLWIVGTDSEADETLPELDLTGPIGIVIGNEGRGLRRLVREHCDFIVSIPMPGGFASLNASVAAGVVLYEVTRQRSNS